MKDLGYLAQDISILHRQYYKDTGALFSEYDLNPTAVCVLLTVHDKQGINQNQVARELVIDKGLATREVKKMVELDLLSKTAGRGHQVLLNTTVSGDRLIPTVQKIRSDWWKERLGESGITVDSPLFEAIDKVVSTIVEPD
ncbi:MarR family winged helix-turn-helix transcriptional regulator [Lentilactobacillus sp. Marseille-Q4993]|uniref:MarR family winged helix-turn-helix transcriptional regulator n=1 Tax=Lentilactobacillus sp. Marseille-Q4993 TaxID=3039492 RepID=UPI0024BC4B35|nr:MarR family winged helix-turn-helix transcriptional regulator [Lentilactobacillus sp. Marseille-Q4993]